jgi:hypothetical protein
VLMAGKAGVAGGRIHTALSDSSRGVPRARPCAAGRRDQPRSTRLSLRPSNGMCGISSAGPCRSRKERRCPESSPEMDRRVCAIALTWESLRRLLRGRSPPSGARRGPSIRISAGKLRPPQCRGRDNRSIVTSEAARRRRIEVEPDRGDGAAHRDAQRTSRQRRRCQ